MTILRHTRRFSFHCCSNVDKPEEFLAALRHASEIPGAGRGGTGMFEWQGRKLVTRQYRHGGLLRAFTGKRFLGMTRAVIEADITKYLYDEGFPTVEPFCLIQERRFLFSHLHLITIYQENKGDLLEYLQSSSPRQRLRMVKKLAKNLRHMEQIGVYHPDLHLKNILVTTDNTLVFLDFDRAERRYLDRSDVIAMARRLNRYVDKMDKENRFIATPLEKALFSRIYERMSGYKLSDALVTSKNRKLFHHFGWFMESFFYRKKI
jgi:tRNA A-37 threonylcarbamoyl transferase component Bud32